MLQIIAFEVSELGETAAIFPTSLLFLKLGPSYVLSLILIWSTKRERVQLLTLLKYKATHQPFMLIMVDCSYTPINEA